MKINAYINTYNRSGTTLPLTILSILNQTYKPNSLTVYDDNAEFKDPRFNPTLKFLLDLSMEKGIQWYWLQGERKGAHFNHEKANLMTDCDYCWFLDDDQVAEPICLENLLKEMKDDVGAVAGLILKTPTQQLPAGIDGTLDDVWKGQNIQWYRWSGKPVECEHLYSSFLYRPGISHWDLRLSRKTFRGETMFTHSFFLKGYKLIVTPEAITWHFEGNGGCRTPDRTPEQEKSNNDMYANDNQIFKQWLDFKKTKQKLYVLREGLGDHYAFLQAYPLEKDAVYAVCYPEPFKGYKTISIAEAEQLVDTEPYRLYKWANDTGWKGTLVEAYKKLYENLNQQR